MKWIFFSLVLVNLGFFLFQLLSFPADKVTVTGSNRESDASLILLSERPGSRGRGEEQQVVLENPVQVELEAEVPPDLSILSTPETDPPESEPMCSSLGPFADLVSASDVAERLNGVDVAVSVKALDQATGDFDYRVVLPPLPSLQEAFRRLRELKSRDIDSYVITDGDDAQGISLGVFSTRDAAVSHRDELVREGYKAVIRDIPRLTREFWIFTDNGVVIPDYQTAAITLEFSGVAASETDCID